MRVLFPSQPFEPKPVDSAFEAESLAAQQAGLDIGLINSEALDQGDYDKAVRRLPEVEQAQIAVYRGWMMTAASYAALYDALGRRHFTLLNDAEEYRRAHHLPDSYPTICDY